jgi:hypothetical protein
MTPPGDRDLVTGEPVVSVEALQLTENEAWAFAEMLKRIGWTEWRVLSTDRGQAELMRAACFKVQRAFADVGIAPR